MRLLTLVAPLVALAMQDDDARMRWWREARVGLLFDVDVAAAGGEPARFEPARFDAKALVAAAKGAGARYVALTAREQGFALFDSRHTELDVAATPSRRDLVREMADACAEAGVVFGLRVSLREGGTTGDERRLQLLEGQLTELLSGYGPIGVLWLDVGPEDAPLGADLVARIRELQAATLLDDALAAPADFATVEPPGPPGPAAGISDWETRLELRDAGGWKPTATIVRTLVDVASRGGNSLLHVALEGDGTLAAEGLDRLAEVGRWYAANGESLRGVAASPFRRVAFGRCTAVPARLPAPAGKSTLFLHVFDWPQDARLRLPGLRNRTVGARLVADPDRGSVLTTRDGEDVLVLLPGEKPDAIDAVVALTISGPPDVARPVAKPDEQGVVKLAALDAELQGSALRFDGDAALQCVTGWSEPRDFLSWEFELPAATRLDVVVEYACPPESAGSELVLAIGAPERPGPELRFAVGSSGAWSRFKSAKAGALPQLAAGRWTLTLKAASKAGDKVANLRSVTLAPAR